MTERGRGNTRARGRGRSQSRGRGRGSGPTNFTVPPPPPNYADMDRIRVLEEEKHKLEQRLNQNEQLAQAAETRPKNPKRDELVEHGKEIMNKFFKGFQPKDRANIQITLDSSFVNRVTEPYYQKIDQAVYDLNDDVSDETKLTAKQNEFCGQLAGAADIGVAIKLYKSAPEGVQDRLFYYNSIHKSQIALPRKLGVVINQLGKTDLSGDNKIRIVGQDLMAKRHLVRGLFRYCTEKDVKAYLKQGTDYADIFKLITSFDTFNGMIDKTSSSVTYIHSVIQEMFDELRAKEHKVIENNGSFTAKISFPPFDFEKATPSSFKEYAENPIFQVFTFKKNKDVLKVAAITALSLMDISWLRDPTQTIGTVLGSDATKTDFDNYVISDLFNYLGFWNINSYFDDRDLNDLSTTVISNWNTSVSPRLKGHIKMENINFSEYGSDAQLVEIDDSFMTRNNSTFKNHERVSHNMSINILKGKARCWVKQKISESGAILGSIVKFNRRVVYNSNFEIMFEGNNRGILREFLKSDFI